MHELALCGSIADIVTKHAAGRPVGTVRLKVGQLRQVVPDTLTYCWELVTSSSPLEGAELAIERVAARLRCDTCGVEHDMGDDFVFACPACDGTTVSVVAGEEFLITSMDVAAAEAPR